MKQNSKLAVLRTMACKAWPRASYAILSMQPVARPGLQTMSVDQHWRLYYDPDWIESENQDALTGVIIHEVCHLLLKHHARAIKVVQDTAENWQLWSIAADAAINEMIFAAGLQLPDGVVTPESIQLPSGKSAEYYYRELCRRRDEQKQKQQEQAAQDQQDDDDKQDQDDQPDDQPSDDGSDDGDQPEPEGQDDGDEPTDSQSDESTDGDDGQADDSDQPGDQPSEQTNDQPGDQPGDGDQDGEPSDQPSSGDQPGTGQGDQPGDDWDGTPAPGQGGSCSDGQARPWELPAPEADDDDQTLDEFDQEAIIKQVAEAIEKHGSNRGYLSTFCDEVLRPKVDPKRLLMNAIRRHTDNIINGGDGKYTYRRPSRRPSSTGMIRPRSFQVIPKIKILIDTSGSMDKPDFMRAMGLVSKCLSSLRCRDGIEVVTGDTRDAWAGKVFDHSKIQLCGGGGTDMGAILTSLDQADDKPDLILCVTDGVTPWPTEKLKTPIVVCLTREPCSFYKIPTWMRFVQI